MNRYVSSFIATALLYVTLLATFLYGYKEPKTLESKNKKSEQNVRFTVVSQKLEKSKPKKVEKPREIVKKAEPKKVIKKIEPKKIVKKIKSKKVEPKKVVEKIVKKIKPKKIIKEKIVKKKEIKKVVKKEVVKQNQKQQIKKTINKDKITKNENINKQKELDKRIYLTKIKETISKNKSYPRSAIRRGIEDDVEICLTISPNGELLSFKIVEGNRIFSKSIKKSLDKSFPMKPKKDIFLSNLDLSLTISYKLF